MRSALVRAHCAFILVVLLSAAACSSPGHRGAAGPAAGAFSIALPPGAAGGDPTPLVTYLKRALGRPVQVRPEAGYAAMAADLRAGRLDAAFASPTGYLALQRAATIKVIGQAATAPTTNPVIVCGGQVPAVSDGGDWKALRGSSFVFGPAGSLGRNVWPRYYMLRNGLDPIGDVPRTAVVADDREAVLDVYNGIADCAAIAADDRAQVAGDAPDVTGRVGVVFTAPAPVPAAAVVTRGKLDAALTRALVQALAGAGKDGGTAGFLSGAIGAPAARPAGDADYALLRAAVAAVNPALIDRAG